MAFGVGNACSLCKPGEPEVTVSREWAHLECFSHRQAVPHVEFHLGVVDGVSTHRHLAQEPMGASLYGRAGTRAGQIQCFARTPRCVIEAASFDEHAADMKEKYWPEHIRADLPIGCVSPLDDIETLGDTPSQRIAHPQPPTQWSIPLAVIVLAVRRQCRFPCLNRGGEIAPRALQISKAMLGE